MASINKDDLRRLYLDESKSIPDISTLIGIPRSTVRNKLVQFAIPLRSRVEGIRAVSHKMGAHLKGKARHFTAEWKKNISIGKRAAADATARGTRTTSNGYVEYTRGEHKGRSVHVVLMEKTIGRALTSDEVVHHRDENKQNNELSNLQLMTRSEHTKHHRGGNK